MKYEVGKRVDGEFDGRALCSYIAECRFCVGPTRFETRAVNEADGTRKEIEVCSNCFRIRKVSTF